MSERQARPSGAVLLTASPANVDLGALVDALNYGRASKSLWFWAGKRTCDIVLATILIVVFVPVLVLISIAIAVESRGNPIFKQHRVGQGLKLFRIYKFRTMYHGVPDLPLMMKDPETGVMRRPTFHEDTRVTRVGRILRRWSLDELPQIFNVLGGDMSFVGPRPLTLIESTRIPVQALVRYSVPSGITGLGQVRDRSIIATPTRFDHDTEYALQLSVSTELSIVGRTFGAIWRG